MRKYLDKSKYGIALFKALNDYYEYNSLNINTFEEIYEKSLKDNSPSFFYSDEKTIKEELPEIRNSLSNIYNLNELIITMRDYIQVCTWCKINYDNEIDTFRKQLRNVININIKQGKTDIFETKYFEFILEKQDLLNIVNEELNNAKDVMIDNWIEQLLQNNFTKKEFDLANKLNDYTYLDEYSMLIRSKCSNLLSAKIFPIEAHNDIQYFTSIILLRMLHRIDSKHLDVFYRDLRPTIKDAVELHRCDCAMNHLDDNSQLNCVI